MNVKQIVIPVVMAIIIAGGGIFYFIYNNNNTASASNLSTTSSGEIGVNSNSSVKALTSNDTTSVEATDKKTTSLNNTTNTNTTEVTNTQGNEDSANNIDIVKIRVPNYMCMMIYSDKDDSPYYTIFSLNTGIYDVQVVNSSTDWCYIKINSEDISGYVLTKSLNYMQTSYDESQTNKEEVTSTTSVYYPQTIIESNSSKISDAQLASLMRQWILKSQYSYSDFAICNGTAWQSQWLDTVSDSEFVSAFENANGSKALSENIKAYELNKAAMLLTETRVKDNDKPFTLGQATTTIKEMLAKSNPNEVVTKVVLNSSGSYYVYTKEGGNSKPWWFVDAYTGYTTGI